MTDILRTTEGVNEEDAKFSNGFLQTGFTPMSELIQAESYVLDEQGDPMPEEDHGGIMVYTRGGQTQFVSENYVGPGKTIILNEGITTIFGLSHRLISGEYVYQPVNEIKLDE